MNVAQQSSKVNLVCETQACGECRVFLHSV